MLIHLRYRYLGKYLVQVYYQVPGTELIQIKMEE